MSSRADLVITGARVWSPGSGASRAAAVAVRDGVIAAVGAEHEVRERAGAAAEVLHVPGALVLPGFQDAHVHAPFAGRDLARVWLHDLPGPAAYLAAVAEYAAAHPDEPWIAGGGWAMEHFPGGTPHRRDLDAVVPDRPVFLFNRDVHGAWLNSRGLELAGITRDTPDPADGRIERDADGEPTGCLHEGTAYAVNDRLLPKPDRAGWEDAILRSQAHLHALGITGWQDAWVTPSTQAAYAAIAGRGELTARVSAALWWERGRGLGQVDDLLGRREAAEPLRDSGFHARTVKIMVDGVLENFTAALLEPYCDGCGGHTANHGLTFVDAEELKAAVTALDGHGVQVHFHALGDRAVRIALDAVEAALAARGPGDTRDRRHHLAHLQVVHPDDVKRFGTLGVTANCQAYWAQNDPQMTELTIPYLGEERAAQQYPFGDLVRAGARLAMGSDWAVSTPDPLQQAEVAVTRADPADRDADPLLPGQALTREQALTAFTAGSAFVNHDDAGGAVEVGRRADLAVLDRDVLDAALGPIGDARVLATLASGKIVHSAR